MHAYHDADRDDALRDDFRLESGSYGYGEDEEWAEDDTNWTAEDDPEEEEAADARDESTAYLEFLNEEVCSNTAVLGAMERG